MPRRRNSGSFKKGLTPWNKGTRGAVKPNKGSFTADRLRGNHFAFRGDAATPNAGHHRAQKLYPARKCAVCGDENRLNKPRWLVRHHRNGNRLDNRPANIQILCRTCHPTIHNRHHPLKVVAKKSRKTHASN